MNDVHNIVQRNAMALTCGRAPQATDRALQRPLWVIRSDFEPRGSSARIEAGHAPAEYEYATAST
jgi:hypothetical protein